MRVATPRYHNNNNTQIPASASLSLDFECATIIAFNYAVFAACCSVLLTIGRRRVTPTIYIYGHDTNRCGACSASATSAAVRCPPVPSRSSAPLGYTINIAAAALGRDIRHSTCGKIEQIIIMSHVVGDVVVRPLRALGDMQT